jgi:hypothetical protein
VVPGGNAPGFIIPAATQKLCPFFLRRGYTPSPKIARKYDAVVKGESELMLDSNTILVPLIVLLFAGPYKMAYLAAKDSKLAI